MIKEKTNGPYSLNVYLTYKCNQLCPFCKRQQSGYVNSQAKDFDAQMASDVISRFQDLKNICIAGFGEPLLSNSLYKVIDVFVSKRISTNVITNGVLLKKHATRILNSGLSSISVSVNASNKEERKTITGLDSWDDMISGIKILISGGMDVSTSFVITKNNWMNIPSYFKEMSYLGIGYRIDLLNLLPHSDDELDINNFNNLTIKDTDTDILCEIDKFKKMGGSQNVRNWPVGSPTGKIDKSSCRSPFNTIGIDGDGNCTSCSRVYGPSDMDANIKDLDVWNSESFINLRSEVSGEKEKKILCSKCWGHLQ